MSGFLGKLVQAIIAPEENAAGAAGRVGHYLAGLPALHWNGPGAWGEYTNAQLQSLDPTTRNGIVNLMGIMMPGKGEGGDMAFDKFGNFDPWWAKTYRIRDATDRNPIKSAGMNDLTERAYVENSVYNPVKGMGDGTAVPKNVSGRPSPPIMPHIDRLTRDTAVRTAREPANLSFIQQALSRMLVAHLAAGRN